MNKGCLSIYLCLLQLISSMSYNFCWIDLFTLDLYMRFIVFYVLILYFGTLLNYFIYNFLSFGFQFYNHTCKQIVLPLLDLYVQLCSLTQVYWLTGIIQCKQYWRQWAWFCREVCEIYFLRNMLVWGLMIAWKHP